VIKVYFLLLLLILLFCVALVDLFFFYIPDSLVLGIVGYGIIQAEPHWGSAMMLGALLLTLKKGVQVYLKKEGVIGWGDIKLISACGLFLSYEQIGFFILCIGLLGSLTGLIFRLSIIPFAPCIGGGFFIVERGWPYIQTLWWIR
jgi:Flp pilus assembly protein protease CpaA